MGGHRLTGPNGTNFLGGVVANCKHKIEFRCTGGGELIPILASRTGKWENFDLSQRLRVNMPRGMTSAP
jgi:hypothetical protein